MTQRFNDNNDNSQRLTPDGQFAPNNDIAGIDDLDMVDPVESEDAFVEGYPSGNAAANGGDSEELVSAYNFATNPDSDTDFIDPSIGVEDTMSGVNNDDYSDSPDNDLDTLEAEGFHLEDPLAPGEPDYNTPDTSGQYYDSPSMGNYANRQLGEHDVGE